MRGRKWIRIRYAEDQVISFMEERILSCLVALKIILHAKNVSSAAATSFPCVAKTKKGFDVTLESDKPQNKQTFKMWP